MFITGGPGTKLCAGGGLGLRSGFESPGLDRPGRLPVRDLAVRRDLEQNRFQNDRTEHRTPNKSVCRVFILSHGPASWDKKFPSTPLHPCAVHACVVPHCARLRLPCSRCVYLLCVRLLCMLSLCALALPMRARSKCIDAVHLRPAKIRAVAVSPRRERQRERERERFIRNN